MRMDVHARVVWCCVVGAGREKDRILECITCEERRRRLSAAQRADQCQVQVAHAGRQDILTYECSIPKRLASWFPLVGRALRMPGVSKPIDH